MSKKLAACVFVSSAFFALAAQADANTPTACCRPQPRWYGAISGMATFLQPTDISHTAPGFPNPDGQSYKIGYGFSGAIGYKLFSGIRTEMEVAFRSSAVKSDPGVILPTDGKTAMERSIALMANAYMDLHNDTDFTPYIGAGVGPAHVKNPRYYTNGSGDITDSLSGWTVAYQFMAGINYEFQAGLTPFELTVGYRYFTGQDLSTHLKNADGSFTVPNDSHNLEMGVKMYF